MTDRQYRQENRTEQKRKEHSTTQQQNVRSLRACFFFPSFAGVGPRGFQLLLFQIHVYVYVCVCLYLSHPGERGISHVARPIGSLVFFFGVRFSRT